MVRNRVTPLLVLALTLLSPFALWAEDPGQTDLDKATELQLRAQTTRDIEGVVKLCESALKKGLDDANTQFARQLLVSALWQHADQLSRAIFARPTFGQQEGMVRSLALRDLDKLLKTDDKFADAYLLRAKLEALPRGDRSKAQKAIDRAIELFKGDVKKQAGALVIRAQLQENVEAQLEDLNNAISVDPSNAEAWQLRAAHYIGRGDLEKAIEDFEKLLEQQPNNLGVRQALSEALTNLQKYDLALEQINKAIELSPDASLNYTLRSQIHDARNDTDKALADLDEAMRLEPRNFLALLMRARLYFLKDNLSEARNDVERLLQLRPGMPRAILLRSMVSAAQGRIQDAIQDVRMLLRADPGNSELSLQLASLYMTDERPRKAIDLLTDLIKKDEGNWMALRTRGDALLSVGKHAEAVTDYSKALELEPENDGILNNLAWVLATSPVDEVRDAKRAIELATKACEVTNYEMPHILSTLGAAYAEGGDFEAAIKWSKKAVELGKETLKEQIEQLEQELESYEQGKPWRELQEVEEKPDPPRNVIET